MVRCHKRLKRRDLGVTNVMLRSEPTNFKELKPNDSVQNTGQAETDQLNTDVPLPLGSAQC